LQDLERRIVGTAGEQGGEELVDVARLLEESLAEIPRASRAGLVIHRDIQPAGLLEAHPDGLRSLFMNIVVNAIESLPPERGGEVHVRLHREGSSIVFTVEDNGRGIPPEIRSRIFNARFTTKRRGTGLGLAWVHRNVTQHLGGQIEVDSGDLEGGMKTRFTVTIPLHRPEANHAASHPDRG
jgi:signal transduction histidine kinase